MATMIYGWRGYLQIVGMSMDALGGIFSITLQLLQLLQLYYTLYRPASSGSIRVLTLLHLCITAPDSKGSR